VFWHIRNHITIEPWTPQASFYGALLSFGSSENVDSDIQLQGEHHFLSVMATSKPKIKYCLWCSHLRQITFFSVKSEFSYNLVGRVDWVDWVRVPERVDWANWIHWADRGRVPSRDGLGFGNAIVWCVLDVLGFRSFTLWCVLTCLIARMMFLIKHNHFTCVLEGRFSKACVLSAAGGCGTDRTSDTQNPHSTTLNAEPIMLEACVSNKMIFFPQARSSNSSLSRLGCTSFVLKFFMHDLKQEF